MRLYKDKPVNTCKLKSISFSVGYSTLSIDFQHWTRLISDSNALSTRGSRAKSRRSRVPVGIQLLSTVPSLPTEDLLAGLGSRRIIYNENILPPIIDRQSLNCIFNKLKSIS